MKGRLCLRNSDTLTVGTLGQQPITTVHVGLNISAELNKCSLATEVGVAPRTLNY